LYGPGLTPRGICLLARRLHWVCEGRTVPARASHRGRGRPMAARGLVVRAEGRILSMDRTTRNESHFSPGSQLETHFLTSVGGARTSPGVWELWDAAPLRKHPASSVIVIGDYRYRLIFVMANLQRHSDISQSQWLNRQLKHQSHTHAFSERPGSRDISKPNQPP
jgi:hypothetical protein